MKKFISMLITVVSIVAAFGAVNVIVNYVKEPEDNPVAKVTYTKAQPPVELTDIGSPYKFYYNQLSELEQRAYNTILSEIYSMPESIKIPRINAEQFDKVFAALLCDNPDLFFVGRKGTLTSEVVKTTCSIEYIIEKEEYKKCRAELEAVCEKVVSSLTSPEDPWQTELEIHDYIVENCDYSLVENQLVYSSAYGALVNGEAACEGYSKAAKMLLDRAGINCAVLSGVSKNTDGTMGPHMWNAVEINGDFYYLDCTWDDPVSEEGMPGMHAYFNVSTEELSATHAEFSYDFACTATAENYYRKKGLYFETYGREDEKTVASAIATAVNEGKDAAEIKFASVDVYEDAVTDLFKNKRIYGVLSEAQTMTDTDIKENSLRLNDISDNLVIMLIPNRV